MWGFLSPRKHSLITGIYWSTFFKKTQHRLLKVKLKFILILKQLFVMKNKFMVIWILKSLKYYIADQGNTGFFKTLFKGKIFAVRRVREG